MPALPKEVITLEEHAAFTALGDAHPSYAAIYAAFPGVRTRLADLSTGRLADMDAGHVSFQVVSQVAGVVGKTPERCVAANDELAAAISQAPTRLGGFACLDMRDPEAAARELERAVTQLGFLGAMIDNHVPERVTRANGEEEEIMTHYDDADRFWGVFAVAARLDVPIYLHPAPATEAVVDARFRGKNFGDEATTWLATGNWGWHEDTGLHVVKLFAAGLFTRFPGLKIVIGHAGEMIPMMIDRIDAVPYWQRSGVGRFRDVWEKNIWVTTSGYFGIRTLDMLLKVTPLQHVLYSIDTPFIDSARGWRFIEELAASGLLNEAELDQFVAGNAKKLFKLNGRSGITIGAADDETSR